MELEKIIFEYRDPSTLIPYARNPRKNDHLVEEMAGKIKEFGMPIPLCIRPDGLVVDGHLRLKAAKLLELKEVPVAVNETWTPAQVKAFRLSANKMAEKAEWEFDLLKLEFEEIVEAGYDLENTSFGTSEIDQILNTQLDENDEKEDQIPETPAQPVSVLGDLWILGEHRLMCGDSIDVVAVARLFGNSKPNMVFTDPPYGISAVSTSSVLSKTYKHDILNDDSTDVAKDAYRLCHAMNIEKMIFWGANYYSSCLPDASCWLVWDKNNGGSDQMDCEIAWTNLPGVTRKFTKASEKTNRVHPTQKPVDLVIWALERFGSPKDTVLDLFGGSGSTLIACEKMGRKCHMMELSPAYCDVIIKRWQKQTGKLAIHEATTFSFDELAESRR